MEFKVENGTNHISIELGGRGEYFRFDNPLSVTWPFSGGTVGVYFCALPYSREYREQLRIKLMDNLDRDFTDDIEELYNLLSPLFSLFKNGDYTLLYYNNNDKEFFRHKTSRDNYENWQYMPVQIAFGDEVNIEQIDRVKQRYDDFKKENEITKKYAVSDIFEFTTNWIYNGTDEFYATQPLSAIDHERVDYFEKLIANNVRPLVIIMDATWPRADFHSPYYVLDGHHKLLAYQKLNIYPPLAVINYHPDSPPNDYDFEKLSTLLYPWQIRQMLDDWDDRDLYLTEKLKNPNSPLHRFIKIGLVKEYHDNKKLKHEAFYVNDKIDGKSLEWYDNGHLKHEHYFKNGKRIGIWKDYYLWSRIKFIQPFDDMNRYDGDIISYYENGQKKWISSLKNGKNVDGVTHLSWFENGEKEAELRYLDGRIIERKNWNKQRKLINHEVYDEEQKRLVKKIPEANPSDNKTPEPVFNIISERQYPKTNYRAIWRPAALLILVAISLLRACK